MAGLGHAHLREGLSFVRYLSELRCPMNVNDPALLMRSQVRLLAAPSVHPGDPPGCGDVAGVLATNERNFAGIS
jgi:hypothetical protein